MPVLTNILELSEEEVAVAIHRYVSDMDGIKQSYGAPEFKLTIRKDTATGEIRPVLHGASVHVRLEEKQS